MSNSFFPGLIPEEQNPEAYSGNMNSAARKSDLVMLAKKRVKTSLYITPALLRRLKVYCARESITMADVLEECISAYLQRKERLADKHNSSNND